MVSECRYQSFPLSFKTEPLLWEIKRGRTGLTALFIPEGAPILYYAEVKSNSFSRLCARVGTERVGLRSDTLELRE